MIIFFDDDNEKLILKIKNKLLSFGVIYTFVKFRKKSVFIVNNLLQKQIEDIYSLSNQLEILTLKKKYKLSNSALFENKPIYFDDVSIDKEHFTVIAGPCTIENDGSLSEIASYLKVSGVNFLRGGAFKPRTSPYEFQGLGFEGLKLIKKEAEKSGMYVVTELTDVRNIEFALKYSDIIQVGARNMQNYALLKELGKVDKPILLKRGMSASINEFLLAADYILTGGNDKVILCERGIKTFETKYRSTLDLTAVAIIKRETHLPVFVDPSHATGDRELVSDLAKASLAVGADGLLVEVHSNPDCAVCDGPQSLTLKQFENLYRDLNTLAPYFNKILN